MTQLHPAAPERPGPTVESGALTNPAAVHPEPAVAGELDRIAGLPLEERAGAFGELHARLTAALDSDIGLDADADFGENADPDPDADAAGTDPSLLSRGAADA